MVSKVPGNPTAQRCSHDGLRRAPTTQEKYVCVRF